MSAVGSHRQAGARIDPATRIGAVHLTVNDLAASQAFYERALGLVAVERDDGNLSLSAPGGTPLLHLYGDSTAAPLDQRTTGLYHLAVLFPTRGDLAWALRRLAAARWPIGGASDHLVSEAVYLYDPDHDGIEIYRDRPRDEWPRADGQLAMDTLPLDLDELLGELGGTGGLQQHAPAGTTMGHVHLKVSDLAEAEAFYSGVLGFEVTVRGYPGALFVSAGGYHHHIGLNTWYSAGAGAPAEGSVGLRRFEVVLPTPEELALVSERVEAAGLPLLMTAEGAEVADPSGNHVLLRAL